MINTPYRKEVKNGILMNPINTMFISPYPNRSARKGKAERFRGNTKRCSLSVVGPTAYHRVIQDVLVTDKETGNRSVKTLYHYILKKK